MTWLKLVYLFAVLGLGLTSALKAEVEPSSMDTEKVHKPKGPLTKTLLFVAKAGGKSYFKEDSGRNWFDSKTFCDSMGMRLATIRTSEEATALRNASPILGYYGSFWIDARESHRQNNFIWDRDQSDLGSAFPYLRFSNQDDLLFWCIDLHVTSDPNVPGWTGFYRARCSQEHQTLCET